MARINTEELVAGGVIALAWAAFTGWWTFLAIPACVILWAMGGGDNWSKSWRRIGVPVVLCGLVAINKWSTVPLLSIPVFYLVLSIGYGCPCPTDEGSWLGRWWMTKLTGKTDWKLVTPKDEDNVTMFVRGTIGLLIGISMLSLANISIPWWLFGVAICIIGYPGVVEVIE